MEREPGDDYLRRFASLIRVHEQRLANAVAGKAPGASGSYLNPLGWVGWHSAGPSSTPRRQPPTMLSLDLHHLYYLLIRFEGLGINVGSLDIRLRTNTRPASYASLLALKDRSDTLSMASFTSAVSKLSLGGSWWARAEPPVDSETKYIYSAFTKLPALSLRQGDLHVIAELADDPPVDNAVPMYAFKNIQTLELLDVDPRSLLGWDHLSETLRSLSIKRGGIEDATDLLVDAVLDDQYRRQGGSPSSSSPSSPSTFARPRMSRFASVRFRQGAPVSVPSPVEEEAEADEHKEDEELSPSPPKQLLPPHKWRLLRHLSLSDNALTFFPITPLASLTSLTHLDLSSNLLVSVPPGLSALYNLTSLNLADNMIDSVLGIYAILGQVLTINLERNRLESLCGLERLVALERIDLRNNRVEDPDEVGRLAVLPNIAEVFVAGNPMMIDEQYRVRCFEHFAQEGKNILLDGSGPSFLEARNMRTTLPPATPELDALEARRRSSAPSPPVVAVGGASPLSPQPRRSQDQRRTSILVNGGAPPATPPTYDPHAHLSSPSSVMSGGSKQAKKRKPKRMVDLDGSHTDGNRSDGSTPHPSDSSPLGLQPKRTSKHRRGASESETTSKRGDGQLLSSVDIYAGADAEVAKPVIAVQRKSKAKKSRHGRYSTEGNPAGEDVSDRLAAAANVDDADSRRPAPVLEVGEDGEAESGTSHADAYRARIDALRSEVGDNWLKVLTQSGGLPSGVTNRS